MDTLIVPLIESESCFLIFLFLVKTRNSEELFPKIGNLTEDEKTETLKFPLPGNKIANQKKIYQEQKSGKLRQGTLQ